MVVKSVEPALVANINELRIAKRPDNAPPSTQREVEVPSRDIPFGRSSLIHDLGPLPASLAMLSRAGNPFSYTIGGRLTPDGVVRYPSLEAELQAVEFRFSAPGLEGDARYDGPARTVWTPIAESGLPADHIIAVSDIMSSIASDYFNSSWASRLPEATHVIYGNIYGKHVSVPTVEDNAQLYPDNVPHLDFFPMSTPALAYFGSNRNPTQFYNALFTFLASARQDYSDLMHSAVQVGEAKRLYVTDDIRTLLHQSDIVQEGYRVFFRFFAGPNLARAIGLREAMDRLLTEELQALVR